MINSTLRACAILAVATGTRLHAFGGAPRNNDCANPTVLLDGATPFSNAGATADGPAPCDLHMGSDVWYAYTAPCTGNWHVSLCTSGFDTVLGAYDGCGCPPGTLLDCNDDFDFCGPDSLQSIVNVPVIAGQCYLLQLGGFMGATGSGTIVSNCSVIQCADAPPACGPGSGACCAPHAGAGCDDCACCNAVCSNDPFCCSFDWDPLCASEAIAACDPGSCAPCPWDLDGTGAVNVQDFLSLLQQWGANPGGPPDFDGNGVVNVVDFLALLNHWGPCAARGRG